MGLLPPARPKTSRSVVEPVALAAWSAAGYMEPLPEVFVVAVRGHRRDTMGARGKNDRNLYDDAMFVFAGGSYTSFDANTDPTAAYKEGVASLMTGVHWYRKGKHGISRPSGGYLAFRPATVDEALPVTRDGEGPKRSKRDGIAIDIHRGGVNGTSSEGCQTLPPEQWGEFRDLLYRSLDRFGLKKFPYILVDGPIA
jgi:lysozyme